MATTEIATILALRVYDQGVKNLANLPQIPQGWIELPKPIVGTGGFAYGVFRNQSTGEVVISYRGTDSVIGPDGAAGILLALGEPSTQAIQAANVYVAVLDQYGSNISFTGHSLGGGLASLMAVFFNRPAIVFDPAPFAATATDSGSLQVLKGSLGASLPAVFRNYDPIRDLEIRKLGVTSFYAEGEFLEYVRLVRPAIYGVEHPIQFGSEFMDMFDMHSQLLLTAGLLSNRFREATVRVQAALPIITSTEFYSQRPEKSVRINLLVDLIRSEQSTPNGGKLTHLAADLQKLGTNLEGASIDRLKTRSLRRAWSGTTGKPAITRVRSSSPPVAKRCNTRPLKGRDFLAHSTRPRCMSAPGWMFCLHKVRCRTEAP